MVEAPPRTPGRRHPPARSTTPVWIGIGLTGALSAATVTLGIVASNRRDQYEASLADRQRNHEAQWRLHEGAALAQERATFAFVATTVALAGTVSLYLWGRNTRGAAHVALAYDAKSRIAGVSGSF